jgi:hypothetical protein
MSSWLSAHLLQMVGALIAVILIAGGKLAVERSGEHKFLLWFAFVIRVAAGLILGWSLRDVAAWITSRPGTVGGVVSSIGGIAAIIAGWWSIEMLVKLLRDVADGVPDDDARRAALWVPTLAPAGLSAAWGIVEHPHGIGTGLTAAVIALISLVFLRKTTKAALASKKHHLPWKWFAVLVCALAGILMIPLLAFADAQVAKYAPTWSTPFRLIVGAVGLALLLTAIADAWPKKNKGETTVVPDGGVRAFAALGVPALVLCGALAVGFVSDHATEQGNVLVSGSMK